MIRMRFAWHITISLLLMALALAPVASANELTGQVSAEVRAFQKEALHQGQEQNNASLALQAEYFHEWESGASLTFTPFARVDSADDERTHMDIRELSYLWLGDSYEFRAGISKVFWGSTEFVHLADIINQDDGVEGPDGEDKLGQPMLHLSIPRDFGVLDLFVLPYFRERTFPGSGGRLRPSIVVDTDNPVYEDPDGEEHVDLAARYSHSIGVVDFGIYHFRGTGREPTLILRITPEGQALVPYYEQIDQSGLDAQVVAGQWLLKFEGIRRTGQGEGYYAGTGGFEYTFTGIGQSAADLGVIVEYVRDDRGDAATTPFNNDIMAGFRLAFNDQSGTELLAGLASDLDKSTRMLTLEASRRIGDDMKATIEARSFVDVDDVDLIYDLSNDDYVLIELAYYF
ncbi:hypothetical protein LCGC14_1956540 [marine sediment metagenome]|uniref:Porin domain-containing protein n=1 Tax=marine sediment metagenome TaxID=412755 RepID=A0A0F9ID22_9ZZZZ